MNNVLAVRLRGQIGICAELYRLHRPTSSGNCDRCGVPVSDCQPRRNSIAVLLAAGVDPSTLDVGWLP